MKSLATWCVRHRRRRRPALDRRPGRHDPALPGRRHRLLEQLLAPPHRVDPGPRPAAGRRTQESGDQERIVFHTTDGTPVTDPQVQATVEEMLTKVERLPHVTSRAEPLLDRPRRPPDQRRQADGLRHRHLRRPEPERHYGPGQDFVDAALTAQGPTSRWPSPARSPSRPTSSPFGGTGLGRAAGRRRAAPRLRLGLRHGPAPPVGAGLAGHRHRADRPAQPRHEDARVLDRAGPADRPRGGRRLRPVHRHPAPAGPHRRQATSSRPSSTPSTPRDGPCCSPGSSCASPCSACSPWASPSSTAWPSPPPSACRSP